MTKVRQIRGRRSKRDISALFRDGRAIDEALGRTFRDLVRRNRRTGEPMVIWRNGHVATVSAADIPLDDDPPPRRLARRRRPVRLPATLDRICFDPEVMGGRACIKETRILVATIVSQVAYGATIKHILADYPPLTAEDVEQALEFAAWLARDEVVAR
jgi:uncharacterized protein (DUF433 family)